MAQAKEDMKLENAAALRTAIEKERADCMTKLDNELRLATQMVEEKDRELKMYRMREAVLIERYKNTTRLLTKSENVQRQTLKDKVMCRILKMCDCIDFHTSTVVHSNFFCT